MGKSGEDARERRDGRVAWTDVMKEGFLDHLASTCNVAALARAIGVHPRSVYNLRRKDAAFVEAWGKALALGYEMVETRLVGQALTGERAADGEAGSVCASGKDDGLEPLDVMLAVQLLTIQQRIAAGRRRRTGPKPRVATPEETDASILRKLKALDKRRKAKA